jgi:hypothetical protein
MLRTPVLQLAIAVALLAIAVPSDRANAHSTAPVSMAEAKREMRLVGRHLREEFDAERYGLACHRRTQRRVSCRLRLYGGSVGYCSARYRVTAHPGTTHVHRLWAAGNENCPIN